MQVEPRGDKMKLLLFIVGLGAGAWFYFGPLPAPGQGPNAAAGKRAGDALVRTMEGYRSARGVYPMSLEELVPEYLAGLPRLSNGSSLEYQRLGPSFKLTFNYTNPLPVHCSYEPATRWDCSWF